MSRWRLSFCGLTHMMTFQMCRSNYAASQKAQKWRENAVNYVVINRSREFLRRALVCLRLGVWKRSLAERRGAAAASTAAASYAALLHHHRHRCHHHHHHLQSNHLTHHRRSASSYASRHVTSLLRFIITSWRRITTITITITSIITTRHASHTTLLFNVWRYSIISRFHTPNPTRHA